MRVMALVLVVLGCLGLGQYGYRTVTGESAQAPPESAEVSPAVAGIAVVSGLLLLTTSTRRTA